MRVQVETPGALRADVVIARALSKFGCRVPGGASTDGWSGIAELQRCAYRYYLKHELKAVPLSVPVAAGPLEIGTYVHVLLAAHYHRTLPKGYPGWQKGMPGPMELMEAIEEEQIDVATFDVARRLIYGYLERYGINDDIEPVAIEYEAGIPGIHTCRYDAIVWKDDALWVLEHKTLSPRVDAMEGWWLDGEIVGEVYAWKLSGLEKTFGAPLTGVIINGLIKSKNPEYRRMEVVIPEKVVESYARDRQFWSGQRDTFRKRGHWPKSLWGCRSIYDQCYFWAHCRDEDSNLIQIRK